jgi:hypothetical protein
VTLLRWFLSLFLFSPFLMESAWGADSRALVEVFCSQTLSSSQPEWKALVSSLEARTAAARPEAVAPEFEACLTENASLFSTAEFAWNGRQMIREASRQNVAERPDAAVHVAFAQLDFELPMVGTISVGGEQPSLSQAVDPYGYEERLKRYEQLWEDFLSGLKERLYGVNGDREVARNTK